MKSTQIILGIDPGTQLMGYALIKTDGNTARVLLMDTLKLTSYKDIYERLEKIHTKVSELIKLYRPTTFAIEAPFFGKNVQSMLKLGRAQGVAIAAALYKDIPIFEYSPKKIKQSITGNGNASKEQVAGMLATLLYIKEMPKYLDATDGLAAAVCHYFQKSNTVKEGKSYTGWKAFLTDNPEREKK